MIYKFSESLRLQFSANKFKTILNVLVAFLLKRKKINEIFWTGIEIIPFSKWYPNKKLISIKKKFLHVVNFRVN